MRLKIFSPPHKQIKTKTGLTYVSPEHRSKGIGLKTIKVAAEFGRSRGSPLFEVGAPDVLRWQRTVDFYLMNDFTEIGSRIELLID